MRSTCLNSWVGLPAAAVVGCRSVRRGMTRDKRIDRMIQKKIQALRVFQNQVGILHSLEQRDMLTSDM